MKPKVDNYAIAAAQAQKRFLSYDQQELIRRCHLKFDEDYLYLTFLAEPYRICRGTGRMQRQHDGQWVDGNSFGEVMTILDWLCDSREDRFISGRWINVVSHGHYFHSNLQDGGKNPWAQFFEAHPDAFARACLAMGGEAIPGVADLGYAIELVDGLRVFVRLWFGDEEFAPRLHCLWEENVTMYLRYETTWYALPLLLARIREEMGILPTVE